MTTLLGLHAQECSSIWMSCPEAEDYQQVIYATSFVEDKAPAEAVVNVITNGYFRLYVNGRPVSPAERPLVRAPHRKHKHNDEPLLCRINVSDFLRNDTNHIALLASPIPGYKRAKVAVCTNGLYTDSTSFIRNTTNHWLCKPVNSFTHDKGKELVYRTAITTSQLIPDTEGITSWFPATILTDEPYRYTLNKRFNHEDKTTYDCIKKVIKGYPLDDNPENWGITYAFENAPYGLLRITFRDTVAGEKVIIGDSEYICNGKIDEQFIQYFSPSHYGKLHISGDFRFSKSHIYNVEILQVDEKSCSFFHTF